MLNMWVRKLGACLGCMWMCFVDRVVVMLEQIGVHALGGGCASWM